MVALRPTEMMSRAHTQLLQCNLIDAPSINQTMEKLAFIERKSVVEKELKDLRLLGSGPVRDEKASRLQERLALYRRMKGFAADSFVGLIAAE